MMKKITFQKKIPFCMYLILLVSIPYSSQAQTVKRQCISSYGTIIMTEKPTLMQTVGQSYSTTASSGTTTSVLQGFQQPVVYKSEIEDSELMNTLNLNVYPNPAAYAFTIQSEELIENSIINVLDINGKSVMSGRLTQLYDLTINCAEWENGIYIITISDKDQNISSLRLTINK